MSRAVRGLLDKGLIERSLHERDGRKITLELTAAGRRTVKAVVQRIGTIQERLFKGYDRHQLREFFSMLRTIESRLRDMHEVPARQRSARAQRRAPACCPRVTSPGDAPELRARTGGSVPDIS